MAARLPSPVPSPLVRRSSGGRRARVFGNVNLHRAGEDLIRPYVTASASDKSLGPLTDDGESVRAARAHWSPVWVVVDGSTDGSAVGLARMAQDDPGLTVLTLPGNRGKGAAVAHGARRAQFEGFTHVLTMDSDGQHPADRIAAFMQASSEAPGAMILGEPQFDASAPALRVRGRKISNALANFETSLSTEQHARLDATDFAAAE